MHPLQGRPGADRKGVRLAVVAFATAIAAGCGDPYRDHQLAYDQIFCEALYRCCTPDQAVARGPSGASDAASCQSILDGQIDGSAIDHGVAAGALHVDSDASKKCLDALKAMYASCDQPTDRSTIAVCDKVVTGSAGKGGNCIGDYECTADTVCAGDVAGGTATCQPRSADGQTCGAGCQIGSVCLPGNKCGPLEDDMSTCETDAQCKSDHCATSTDPKMPQMICAAQTVRLFLCGM